MASCLGKRGTPSGTTKCGMMLYRCKKCGAVGCEQGTEGKCSNQTFKSGKCLKCGQVASKEVFR